MTLSALIAGWWSWILASSWQLAVVVLLVAAIAGCMRKASPRLRHALWMLVLVKAFLPPGLTAPWSLGQWIVTPVMQFVLPGSSSLSGVVEGTQETADVASGALSDAGPIPWKADRRSILFAVWLGGAVLFATVVSVQYLRVLARLRRATIVDEGPLRIALEDAALKVRLASIPELVVMDNAPSPFLIGLVRPRIVLPASMVQSSNADLAAVLAHELVHWKRRDTWTGWIQVVVQAFLWFHPLIWWANDRIRHERECACDEEVLRMTSLSPAEYGESIVQRLTASRGRTLAFGNVVGVLERNANLQLRLEQIMNYETKKRQWQAGSWAILFGSALIVLPLASGRAADADDPPIVGEWKVVQFERGGKSPPDELLSQLEAVITAETLTLKDARGFESATYLLTPSASPRQIDLVFTEGQNKDVQRQAAGIYAFDGPRLKLAWQKDGQPRPEKFSSQPGVRTSELIVLEKKPAANGALNKEPPSYPVIVSTTPKVGDTDVDPGLKEVTVTFDRDMGKGMSWTGGGPMFPADESRQAKWKNDRTCVLPVLLKEGQAYRVGINSTSYQKFQSKDRKPTPPSAIYFATKGASDEVKRQVAIPKVASIEPANGAKDVDPATTELKVTFDIPMGTGMSWTGGGDAFPTVPEGQMATWSNDGLTCTLPVTLKPGHTYRLGLNSLSHINFQSAAGVPLEPVTYVFTTRK